MIISAPRCASPLSTITILSEESIVSPSRLAKFSPEPNSSPVSEPSGNRILTVLVAFCATKINPVLFCAIPTGLLMIASSTAFPRSS